MVKRLKTAKLLGLAIVMVLVTAITLSSFKPKTINGEKPKASDTSRALCNTSWILLRTQMDGRLTGVGNSRVFTFGILDSTFFSYSFCNNINANYKAYKDGTLKIYRISIGEKICSRPTMDTEREYLNNLRNVNNYKLENGGDRLKLLINKEVVAIFKRFDNEVDAPDTKIDTAQIKVKK